MDYIGEHTLPGDLGRLFVILTFTSALLSGLAYAMFWQRDKQSGWKKIARTSFLIHAGSVFAVVGTLFYMMLNHYYEYSYVWSHTSNDLPVRYMFSSFWEGQEGSFLLWMFWHAVLGIILMFTARKWESSTMIVLMVVQAFLASMLLGIYIGDVKIGQSPFVLIRELPEYFALPWTQQANYLQMIEAFRDGQGLNPLLRNYWMTIHPPTLFLGFASTVIPFAYAIAGLITGNHKSWIKPAIPWAFFSVGILGTGILMGGAWAYEALSFGGFWAWDPVENASLVPWLMMVGAAHLLLIQKNRGGSLPSAYLLTIFSFLLILYSTFLTRSGILGKESVHSFVDLGLSGQLLLYLLTFVVAGLGLFFWRFKSLKKGSKEDEFSSREFWMFIGAMVLLLSSLQITISTSTPVWDTLFGPEGTIYSFYDTNKGSPDNPIEHYNRYQLPFAIVATVLVAIGQFLTYRKTASSRFTKGILVSVLIAVALTLLISLSMDIANPLYIVLAFTSTWAIVANLDFWLRFGRHWKGVSGASVAHVGFGMIVLGTLISQGKQSVISSNEEYIHKDFPQNENLLLNRDSVIDMAGYHVQWFDEYNEGGNTYFPLRFRAPGDKDVSFILEPFIQKNEKMGNVSEPSTKHYWNRDIYTHVTFADSRDSATRFSPWQNQIEASLIPGDESIIYETYMLRLDSISIYRLDTVNGNVSGASIGAILSVTTMTNEVYTASPVYSLGPDGETREDAIIDELGLKFRFQEADPESGKIIIQGWKLKKAEDNFIIIKAIVFPHINILWLGCITLALGSFIAVFQRLRKNRKNS